MLPCKTEFLEERLGRSVILDNACRYVADQERHLVADFIREYWAEREQELVNRQALAIFGTDAAEIRNMHDFEEMARERLLPEDARKCIAEVAKRCERPQDFASLKNQLLGLEPERVKP